MSPNARAFTCQFFFSADFLFVATLLRPVSNAQQDGLLMAYFGLFPFSFLFPTLAGNRLTHSFSLLAAIAGKPDATFGTCHIPTNRHLFVEILRQTKSHENFQRARTLTTYRNILSLCSKTVARACVGVCSGYPCLNSALTSALLAKKSEKKRVSTIDFSK